MILTITVEVDSSGVVTSGVSTSPQGHGHRSDQVQEETGEATGGGTAPPTVDGGPDWRDPSTLFSTLTGVHPGSRCSGEHCVVHNPSEHHMRRWPMVWRNDKGVVERTCPHGVGHPDPDDEAHHDRQGRWFLTVHGCDGCCSPIAGLRPPMPWEKGGAR